MPLLQPSDLAPERGVPIAPAQQRPVLAPQGPTHRMYKATASAMGPGTVRTPADGRRGSGTRDRSGRRPALPRPGLAVRRGTTGAPAVPPTAPLLPAAGRPPRHIRCIH